MLCRRFQLSWEDLWLEVCFPRPLNAGSCQPLSPRVGMHLSHLGLFRCIPITLPPADRCQGITSFAFLQATVVQVQDRGKCYDEIDSRLAPYCHTSFRVCPDLASRSIISQLEGAGFASGVRVQLHLNQLNIALAVR